jgi:asparagine synthase (glutamine-hydrolysing)
MCGICGEVSLQRDRPPAASAVGEMCEMLHHRGPDDRGVYSDCRAALGSSRLAIIDLAGGKQPIHNGDSTIWIVFNGEIYNFLRLRRQLEHLGHTFYTRSDTEVIVHAYEEFGTECVQHLNGIFAFAIWDTRRERLFLARDRMGIKPLLYAVTDEVFVFASELKPLVNHPCVERRIDLVSLNEYLTFEYVPTPRSIIKGVQKLPPGHTLTVKDGHIDIRPYWDVRLERSEGSPGRKSLAEHKRELVEQLETVTGSELISDVPVGILLSGGIDSSALALAAAKAYPGTVKTFTAAFEDPSFDESRYARMVAEQIGAEHHEFMVSAEDLLGVIPRLGELIDEPLSDSSFVPTYLLCYMARKHVKVALGGDGGDELFAGYPTYQAHRLVEYYERLIPGYFRRNVVPTLVRRIPTSFDNISLDFKLKRFIGGRGLPLGVRHHLWLGSFTPSEKMEMLQPWAQVQERDVFEVVYEHQQRCSAEEPVNRMLYWDMKMYLEGDILQKVDRASMACSLEVRVPLLNHTFVEWVTAVPHDLKLGGLTTKYLFRKSLEKVLPAAITRRPKKGFNMPVAKWLAGPLRELLEDTLAAPRLQAHGFFEPRYVRRLMDEHYAQRVDHRKLLWTILVFQLWYDQLCRPAAGSCPEQLAQMQRLP